MLKIGDFSKVSRVSVKTLRYYDEIGLLKPSQTDRFTSYRYYTLDQLPRLNRILALKDLGLSLEQIALLLEEQVTPEQVRGMLRLKQAELQQIVDEEQARLERVAARLRQMESEGTMPAYEVVIKPVDPMRIVSVKSSAISIEEIGSVFSGLFGELWGFVYANQITPAGAPLSLYYTDDPYQSEMVVEVGVPIAQAITETDRIKMSDLPAVTTASTIYHGSYTNVGEAYSAIVAWIEANGYHIAGPSREVYLHFDPQGDPAQNITEIQFPVTKE